MIKNLGLSLIEALLSITVLCIVSLGFMQYLSEAKEKELQELFAQNIVALLSAVDKRVTIDVLDENNLKEQLTASNFGTAIKQSFISSDQECGDKEHGWQPKNGENILLLPCDLWKSKVPYGFKVDPIIKEKSGKITSVSFIFSLPSQTYSTDKSLMVKLYTLLQSQVNTNMLGTQSYTLIDGDNRRLNKMECVRNVLNCKLKAEFKVTPMFILNI